MSEQIVKAAKALCEKFINKVETGRARSHETYAECESLLILINELEAQSSQPDNACPKYHSDARKQGWSICPYCDQKLSGG